MCVCYKTTVIYSLGCELQTLTAVPVFTQPYTIHDMVRWDPSFDLNHRILNGNSACR